MTRPPIRIIKRPALNRPTAADLLSALLVEFGCKASGYDTPLGQETYHDRWELFDPELVREGDELDAPWDMVYARHMQPNMRDCRELRYRYVHCPVKIFPQYPHFPCRGIFVLCSRSTRSDRLNEGDLIFIGDEFI